MRVGQLSDFTQKELDHPTFTVNDETLTEDVYFILGSLSVPSECSTIVQSVNYYVNSNLIKPSLLSIIRRKYPRVVDPTFEYVARNARSL